ncbi:MAG: hypothetical protein SV487_09500 [Thermodesulfobacteriota bacterium]|nr:hypothetical protein [Thermodesulfobacteriota bacterium]
MSAFTSIKAAAKAAAALATRDRNLSVPITYKRVTDTDFDPAAQSGGVTSEDTALWAVPMRQVSQKGLGRRPAGELYFLINAAQLSGQPAPGDSIVQGNKTYLVTQTEKDSLSVIFLAFVKEV